MTTTKKSYALAATIAALAFPPAAHAASTDASASDPLFIAAGQAGGQRSTYSTVGGIVPLPGSQMGNGWVARVFADEITYRYKLGTQNIDGTAFGGSITAGYQVSNSNGWLGFYAGPGYRDTHFSPGVENSRVKGGATTAHFQVEGEEKFNRDFKADANATYDAFDGEAYWTRLRLLSRLTGQMYVGPEGMYQGDIDYHAWSAGMALVGIPLAPRTEFGVDAGIRKVSSESASGYAGLELGTNF